jgi:hypothetical protein
VFSLFVRRVRIVVAAALVTSLWMVPSASAVVPPGGGGPYYSCNTMAAGYTPGASGSGSAWAWDGRLGWDWCVARTTTGSRYAIVRLSSPGPTLLSGSYDRAWAALTIKLQACGSYTTLASTTWNPNYAVGSLSGSRYYWAWKQTASSSSSATSYRVQISGSGYVFRHNLGGWYFSLGAGPYPPSPASYHTYTSGCVNP